MKLADYIIKPPPNPPRQERAAPDCPPRRHQGDGQPLFFAHIVKVAGITRKELQYDMRLSKTYVDMIMAGEKLDPFSRSREFCTGLHRRKRVDLVIAVLVYIAGLEFDGSILNAVQVEAIKELAKTLIK